MTNLSLGQLLNLQGKTAIVTGGAMGIGEGISRRLAEAGANIVIADLAEVAGTNLVTALKQAGGQAAFIQTDVSQEAEVLHLVQKTIETFGLVDILINNAGIYPALPLSKMQPADFERVIDVNLKSVYLCTRFISEQMITQGKGGRIINITSIDALHPSMVGLAHYDASKHGVWGFTKNVALELAEYKIWVNAIAPGGIATPGVAKMSEAGGVDQEKVIAAFLEKIPMHRFGEPDDIGKVALFLASEMSSYMTGTQIVVDGGVLLR
jgi:2-deoxy-D-gluconate 3-dehydrogenase